MFKIARLLWNNNLLNRMRNFGNGIATLKKGPHKLIYAQKIIIFYTLIHKSTQIANLANLAIFFQDRLGPKTFEFANKFLC